MAEKNFESMLTARVAAVNANHAIINLVFPLALDFFSEYDGKKVMTPEGILPDIVSKMPNDLRPRHRNGSYRLEYLNFYMTALQLNVYTWRSYGSAVVSHEFGIHLGKLDRSGHLHFNPDKFEKMRVNYTVDEVLGLIEKVLDHRALAKEAEDQLEPFKVEDAD